MVIKEGDWISLNGTKGLVYEGSLPLVDIDLDKNQSYKNLMKLVDKDQTDRRTPMQKPRDAIPQGLRFGAEGIGLFRTEHMFYGEGSEQSPFPAAQDDREQDRKERRNGAQRALHLCKERYQGYPRNRERSPGHHPVAGSRRSHEFVPHDAENCIS